uniref:SCAN box domain-containing protein n=1 Tax=Sciurus vulgaris TaxID=55149 RepID=A0A8D2CY46_SCIVU
MQKPELVLLRLGKTPGCRETRLLEGAMTLRADAATEAAWLCKGDPMLHDHSNDCEVLRQHFRQFQYTEAAGPREAFSRLWELCCRWLKPKMRSMEQILELLVLEQFLTILPVEMETWVSAYGPEKSGLWVILWFEYEVFPQSSSLNAGMFRGKMTRL